MENLPFNGGSGQSYGLIIYRKIINVASTSAILKITGHVRDIALVLVDGEQRTQRPVDQNSLNSFGFWPAV
jgi:hypothetical protein